MVDPQPAALVSSGLIWPHFRTLW